MEKDQIREKLLKEICCDCSLIEECEAYYPNPKGCPALERLVEYEKERPS